MSQRTDIKRIRKMLKMAGVYGANVMRFRVTTRVPARLRKRTQKAVHNELQSLMIKG